MTEPTTTVPLKGVRGMAADHMRKSLDTAAQLTHHASADASKLLLEKSRLQTAGHRVSIEDLLIFATVRALKQHPEANGRVSEHEIQLYDAVHLSIAVSLPDNLLVAPTLFDVDKLSLLELNAARKELADRAKSNKVSVKEMTGGTFTVSNLGLSRVEYFTPIINLPQICVLGIGCLSDRAALHENGNVVMKPYVGLSLTFDHRALNGAPAALFLSTLCKEIESIEHSAS